MRASPIPTSDTDDETDEKVHLIRKKPKSTVMHQSDDNNEDGHISIGATTDDDSILTEQQYGATAGDGFRAVCDDAVRAIHNGIFPERISQGSSGSYFVKNEQGSTIGVFKPKNEEPYGHLNPKWLKWFHKIFLPCCFGRSCLIPNQGYLSEAGASLVDRKLGLNVVPQTGIVELAAPTFCYGRFDRAKARTMERIYSRYPDIARRVRMMGLPPKRGSFQLFVVGYKDAAIWLKQWESNKDKMSDEEKKNFQFQFEKIVILDYIIRNTDRGNDNWLIKCETESNSEPQLIENENENANLNQEEEEKLIDFSDSVTDEGEAQQANVKKDEKLLSTKSNTYENGKPFNRISIAAIDNGLAFPFKHPDEWRTYPFGWASLPQSRIPFSDEIVNLLLPLLNNTEFVKELGEDLRNIFKIDRGFDKHLFERQLSVVRGQIFNLREALRLKKSPYQLVAMPPQYMVEVKKKKKSRFRRSRQSSLLMNQPEIAVEANPLENEITSETSASSIVPTENSSWHEAYQQKVHTRNPFFRWW